MWSYVLFAIVPFSTLNSDSYSLVTLVNLVILDLWSHLEHSLR